LIPRIKNTCDLALGLLDRARSGFLQVRELSIVALAWHVRIIATPRLKYSRV